MEYRQGSHTKFKTEFYFVWVVTKYRYHVLQGDLAQRMRELVRQTCEQFEIQILWGVVCKDHMHILVSAPLDISPSDIMRRVKGRVSRKIFKEFPHVKKRYWGQHFWAREYFCVTFGELTKEMIQEYLAHHFEKDPNDRFDIKSINRLMPVSLDFQSASSNPPASSRWLFSSKVHENRMNHSFGSSSFRVPGRRNNIGFRPNTGLTI